LPSLASYEPAKTGSKWLLITTASALEANSFNPIEFINLSDFLCVGLWPVKSADMLCESFTERRFHILWEYGPAK
jgi:hypothetical protein